MMKEMYFWLNYPFELISLDIKNGEVSLLMQYCITSLIF